MPPLTPLLSMEPCAATPASSSQVVGMFGICTDTPERTCLLLEFAPHGSLRAVLDDAAIELPEAARRTLLRGIVSGMARLHSQQPHPILHHDLKSHNVLVFDDWCAKITDFGLSVGGGLSTLSISAGGGGGGTCGYKAPELFGGAGGDDDSSEDDEDEDGGAGGGGGSRVQYTSACDVYSSGLIAWELLTRAVPWAGKLDFDIINAVCRGRRPKMNEAQKGSFLGTLAARCWAQRPEQRPSFAELMPLFGSAGRMVQVCSHDRASSRRLITPASFSRVLLWCNRWRRRPQSTRTPSGATSRRHAPASSGTLRRRSNHISRRQDLTE